MTLRPNQTLNEKLECAVLVTWEDLIHAGTPGLVHIKYRYAADHSLASLQVWACETSGYWKMVCECLDLQTAIKDTSVTFSNGYRSDALTQLLKFVVKYQREFYRIPDLNPDRLAQIQVPTNEEKIRACKLVGEALAPEIWREQIALAYAS
jgi:hypothetical protein